VSASAQQIPCCGGGPCDTYEYGPQPFVIGEVETFSGPVPQVASSLTRADRLGAWRVRWNIGRSDFRVKPGLYALGEIDDTAPVIVTANYKLTFDAVRSALAGRSAWVLVLDTRGINVWCAAGKGTFGTQELVRQLRAVNLSQVVSHQTIVVPQLGATGVAAHEVRAATGFRVTWGPVRAGDLPAFLEAGMKASPEMRRVTFGLRDRAVLVPVELSVAWSPKVLAGVAVAVGMAAAAVAFGPGTLGPWALATMLAAAAGLLVGAAFVPLLLPWIPGRAFALKGALLGLLAGAAVIAFTAEARIDMAGLGPIALASAVASFGAMNFTGSSTYTSPTGVEWEMRRAIPAQALGVAIWLASAVLASVSAAA
jgi:hypothetical protein